MRGLHLTCDLRDCAAERDVMTDTATLRALCLEAVARAGLTAVGDLFHRYVPADAARPPAAREAPSGITGVVLLAESHLAVHTWPELRAATLDVYVCNVGDDNSAKAERLLATLVDAFAPSSQERHARRRGSLAGSA